MLRLGKLTMVAMLVVVSAVFADEQRITVTIKTDDDASASKQPPFDGRRAAVDIALLLDTSNSMDGLISQAKNQLWTIVQEFAQAKRQGQTPILRVALFEYGNSGLPASEGYIRQVVQLTDDLDELSDALFALRTNGGDEYCGQVIREALKRLDWTNEPNSYKAIFIAGNEPFTQGTVNYQESCSRAIESGVVVNTIHCGDYQTGIRGKWKHGAELAEGEYFNIDQDRKQVHIICPQDEIILKLNAELNKTYLWFGEKGRRGMFRDRQTRQDSYAKEEADSTLVNRAVAKAGAAYQNASRDLVDAVGDNKDALRGIAQERLPDEMQKMSETERQEYVEKMATQRAELQRKIAALNVDRQKYIKDKRQEMASEAGEDTLGDAVAHAVRKQLVAAGFELETTNNP